MCCRQVSECVDLPREARAYIERIEDLSGVNHAMVAVGPKRSQTIVSNRLF
ncbi:MAG: adenylosuccinate synthetase [Syntrophomonas sp.]|nr:adenylosuccinate synthetase [Syntrophomonas sp.]